MALSVLPMFPFPGVIYGTHSQIYLTGHNMPTGDHSVLSTYQAKVCRYIGALDALQAILKTFPPLLNSPHITPELHIDNLGIARYS
jgi:hypothetical protein